MVSKELVEKFQNLYQERFGITLTTKEATKMAKDLVKLMGVLMKRSSKVVR